MIVALRKIYFNEAEFFQTKISLVAFEEIIQNEFCFFWIHWGIL